MKRTICNTCSSNAPMQGTGLGPAGWYRVDLTGGEDERTSTRYPYAETRDYCSPACAVVGIKADVKAETDLTLAQEAVAQAEPIRDAVRDQVNQAIAAIDAVAQAPILPEPPKDQIKDWIDGTDPALDMVKKSPANDITDPRD